MRSLTRPLLAAIAASLLLTIPLCALEVPPPPTRWYTDQASLLDSSEAAALDEKLRAFEQQSGAQFIIYVFRSLEGEAVEDFTIRCAERWKAGNAKYDNGLILFVFVEERKVRIEVGYGLEGTITDAFSSRVIREQIAPRFQQGDYAGGLNAAADAIIARITSKEAPVEPVRGRGGAKAAPGGQQILFLLIVIVVLVFVASAVTRSRPGCSGCIWPMFFWPGGGGTTFGGGGFSGGGGFGGFSGGGGGFGGGGATGGW